MLVLIGHSICFLLIVNIWFLFEETMRSDKFKIKKRKKFFSFLRALVQANSKWLMGYDVVISILSLNIARLVYVNHMGGQFSLIEYFCFPVFFLITGSIVGLYERNIFNDFLKLFLSLFVAVILALICFILLRNVFLYEEISRHILALVFFCYCCWWWFA